MRVVVLLLLLTGLVYAHGGSFRPPPGSGGGDPTKGGGGGGPSTRGGSSAGSSGPWEAWWNLNREPFLRLRERMIQREVITGPTKRTDLFDRKRLREQILAPEILKALRSDAHEVRGSAAIVAGKFGMKRALPVLWELYRKDKYRQVKEAALLGLLLMRDPSLQEAFRQIALDSKEQRRLRGFALLALGFLEDTKFLARVATNRDIHLLGSNTLVNDARACASLALGFSGDEAAMAPLLQVALDKEAPRSARGYAAGSLGRLGLPLALPEVLKLVKSRDTLKEARYGAAIAAGQLVQPTEAAIIDKMAKWSQRDKNGGVRALLVMSLGRIGGERAMNHLLAGMKDAPQRLRGFHYLALGIMGRKEAGPALAKEMIRQKNHSDRAAAALAVGLLGYGEAADVLRELTAEGHLGFAPHGMVALGLLDDRKAIPVVSKLLKEKDPFIRREGAIALALLRRSAAIPELVKLLETSKARYTRGAIAIALGLVGTDKAVPPLLKLYRDKTRPGEERAVFLAALGRIGDPEPIPLLSRVAFDLNPYVVVDAVYEVLSIL